MPAYQGRTELLKDGIVDGNVSLKIFNTEYSDEGQYYCFVHEGTSNYAIVLDLNIAGQCLL